MNTLTKKLIGLTYQGQTIKDIALCENYNSYELYLENGPRERISVSNALKLVIAGENGRKLKKRLGVK